MSSPLVNAIDPNPGLRKYSAAASLTIDLHAFVPIRRTFTGTAYYQRPLQRIVFDRISGPLQRFRELSTTLPTRQDLLANYVIDATRDSGAVTHYDLRPRVAGRVRLLALSVDDSTSLVTDALWDYAAGGRLSVHLEYAIFGGFHLPRQELITARFPAYNADGILQLTNYRINGDGAGQT